MFIMVPLCGICFINVTLVMSGNSCPVFIACVAKLDLYISGFLYTHRMYHVIVNYLKGFCIPMIYYVRISYLKVLCIPTGFCYVTINCLKDSCIPIILSCYSYLLKDLLTFQEQ